MSNDMIKYAPQLRRLIDDYYHQQITVEDYKAQRKLIFDQIEKELAGVIADSEASVPATQDETISNS